MGSGGFDREAGDESPLPVEPGVGAHLLLGIEAASRPKTKEAALRGAPDAVADWVLMVEGEDEDAVLAAADGPVAPRALESLGAAPGSVAAVYRLRHAVGAEDI